jgi:hypothetical protein
MTHRLRKAALVAGLLTSLPAFAQITARPAAVLIVARLESLSVAQTSMLAAARPFNLSSTIAAAPPIAVTSTWAVPANSTTMRVDAYTIGSQPLEAGASVPSTTSQNPLPLFIQTVLTNSPTSRTDSIPAASPSAPSGVLLIVAQAL